MNDRLLRAIRREPVDATPVWFMRQAGRSLPRFRELRADIRMLEVLRDPVAAAEITALPLDHYSVDACVLFNDLSTPFVGAGFGVEMRPGIGPIVSPRIRSAADADRLIPFDAGEVLRPILDQIRLLVTRLSVPVIGFVGAPFTMVSYLIDGPGPRNVDEAKAFMWSQPRAWERIMTFWADHLADFGVAQYEAGAPVIQVFDSWVGALAPRDYERHVLPATHRLLERLREAGVPTVHYAGGNPALLPLVADAGGDVIGLDWRIPIDEAWALVGEDRGVQGNLDPAVLLAGLGPALDAVDDILDRVGGRPGHIFNVGHGILPTTDPALLAAVVDRVHERTS